MNIIINSTLLFFIGLFLSAEDKYFKIGFIDLQNDIRYTDWGRHPVDIRSKHSHENRAIEGAKLAIIDSKKLERITKTKIILDHFSIKDENDLYNLFNSNKLKEYNVNSIVKMASSYKFCVIATGEYDIYAAKERANEWDYAAGHAVAQNAGAIIKTLDEKPFLYGKEDYRNPSLLIKRAENLDV